MGIGDDTYMTPQDDQKYFFKAKQHTITIQEDNKNMNFKFLELSGFVKP